MAKMTPEEDKVFMGAFSASKAKTVKERQSEAQAALEAWRAEQKKPKGEHVGLGGKMKARMKALDKAIEDGSR